MGRWWLAIYHNIRSCTYCSVIRGIVPPLCQWQPVHPILWPLGSHTTKRRLKAMINNLCLPISLWVIRSWKLDLSAYKLEQFLPKGADKNLISVRHYTSRHPMKLIIHEHLGNRGSWVGVGECHEVSVLAKAIHDHQDNRFTLCKKQALQKIHGYFGPYCLKNRERLKQAKGSWDIILELLTHRAGEIGRASCRERV